MTGLKIIDGTPTEISNELREKELRKKILDCYPDLSEFDKLWKEIKAYFTKSEEIGLSKEELTKILDCCNREHIQLVHWLYKNYKPILREYEKSLGRNIQVEFL